MRASLAVILTGILAAAALGCAVDWARVSEMRVRGVEPRPSPLPGATPTWTGAPIGAQTVHLVVNGLGVVHPLFLGAFREAVAASVSDSGLFAGLAEPGDADLRLDVILGDMLYPDGGNGNTVELTILWTLSERESAEVRWQSLVWSTFHPEPPEGALLADDRIRRASEGAARENIRQALQLLADASLASDQAPAAGSYTASPDPAPDPEAP